MVGRCAALLWLFLAVALDAENASTQLQQLQTALEEATVHRYPEQRDSVEEFSATVLRFLHSGCREEHRDNIFGPAVVKSDELSQTNMMAEACGSQSDSQLSGGSLTNSAVWHIASSLQTCGVRGVHQTWPLSSSTWQTVALQSAFDLKSLAEIRSDNASLICRLGRQSIRPKATSEDGSEIDEMETDEKLVTPTRSKLPRCPRCGKSISFDKAAQAELMSLHRGLTEETTLADMDNSLLSGSAACAEEVKHVENELVKSYVSGGASALLSSIELLGCGTCELEAIARLALAEKVEVPEASAFAALAYVRCSSVLDETSGSVEVRLTEALKALERAIWKGVAFPLLHEAASKAIFGLRRSRLEYKVSVAAAICKEKHNTSITDFMDSWSLVDASMHPGVRLESDALGKWGSASKGGWNPLRIGLTYFDLVAGLEPLLAAHALALGALWFRRAAQDLMEARDQTAWLDAELLAAGKELTKSILGVIQATAYAAYKIAVSSLSPGSQFLVLSVCSKALVPLDEGNQKSEVSSWSSMIHSRFMFLAKNLPFASPAVSSLMHAQRLASIAERLHDSFAFLIESMGAQGFPHDTAAVGDAQLSLFEAAIARRQDTQATLLHPFALRVCSAVANYMRWEPA
eukprot:TRINITY_DN28621_c0_g1_i2.p1 TRINITY_DN28621_c0_g1~~TRINITY_DN28621_c0_g1_i2.p1  ORF type:complete len:643 (+),score=109.45 TRINITY_DN28621_c0_g1_i2:25-1929(+)